MSIANMKKQLADLRTAAKLAHAGNPLLPKRLWPPPVQRADKEFNRILVENGRDYEWLLENLHLAPKLPPSCYKEKYRHLLEDRTLGNQTELYRMALKGIR